MNLAGVRSAQPVLASPRPPRAAHRPAAARAPRTRDAPPRPGACTSLHLRPRQPLLGRARLEGTAGRLRSISETLTLKTSHESSVPRRLEQNTNNPKESYLHSAPQASSQTAAWPYLFSHLAALR